MLLAKRLVTLEVTRGHLKWKVSELARSTKVSRPLLYYHFGKTKAEILNNCVDFVIEEYFGFTPERLEMVRQGRILESLILTRRLHEDFPALTIFYQRARAQASPLQEKFLAVEQKYQAKLKSAYPHLSKSQVVAVHAFFHSLVSAPFLTEADVKEAYGILVGLLQPKSRA